MNHLSQSLQASSRHPHQLPLSAIRTYQEDSVIGMARVETNFEVLKNSLESDGGGSLLVAEAGM